MVSLLRPILFISVQVYNKYLFLAVGQDRLPLVASWEGGCRKQLSVASQRVNHSSFLSIVPSHFLFYLQTNMLPYLLPFGTCLVLILMQYSGMVFSLFFCPPSRLALSPIIQYSVRVPCVSILWSWKTGHGSLQHPSINATFPPHPPISCRVIGDSPCAQREESLFSWCSLPPISHEGGSSKKEDWIWWGFWLLSFSHCLDPPQAIWVSCPPYSHFHLCSLLFSSLPCGSAESPVQKCSLRPLPGAEWKCQRLLNIQLFFPALPLGTFSLQVREWFLFGLYNKECDKFGKKWDSHLHPV